MGYRCNGCMLFCSVSEWEISSQGLDMDTETGEITGEFEIILSSECCGDQVASASVQAEILAGGWDAHCVLKDHNVELEEPDMYDQDEMWEPAGRPLRYQRHHYGFIGEAIVRCDCGEEWNPEIKAFIQASEFETY